MRNARQVSHPNVCRVYDIGEVNGQHFLTMEYIDGEDLASLLRRIGRLPPDKALETAHQICAGLAAAHDCGLLHRDLKPANIMLDGRGRVRITDFGLALSSDDATGRSETAGTPAYMAPEQIGKGEASVRSDIYSLGLVFYELFTGHLPYQANTPVEWRRAHLESSPRTPSSVVKDIDPAVESAILRCLQKDPAKRPSSVRQVAAAFPGGDPLAAALAAGETPSPEMVAASGETEGLRPADGLGCAGRSHCVSHRGDSVECTNHALPARAARKTAGGACRARAGYSAECRLFRAAGGHGDGVLRGEASFSAISRNTTNRRRAGTTSKPGRSCFGIAAAPGRSRLITFFSDAPILGSVWTDDPPLDVSGMTLVRLNPLGRLTQLIAVPPQVEKPAGAASSPDWAPLFSAAGLDPSKWPPAQPMWTPPVYSDARAAWTGSLAERPNIPMRIEAAAYRGKPVYFELIGPWTRPERMQPYQPTAGERAGLVIFIVLLLSVLVGQRNARPTEPAPWPGRSPGGFSSGSFCFCGLGGGVVFWRASRPELRRIRALHRVFGLGVRLVLSSVGSLHCFGALCAPPLARHAGLLEPLAGGRLSGSTGGTRCACRLSLGAVYGRSSEDWGGLFPPGSAILRRNPIRVQQWQFLGARTIVADVSLHC